MTGGAAGLNQIQPNGPLQKGPAQTNIPKGDEFKRTLESLTGAYGPAAAKPVQSQGAAAVGQLKFSNHAIERMRSRGISYDPQMMKDIEGAVQKAAAKGSKDTLVLAGDSALIVSVKNNTVVTVMDRAAMKENVFTNIDSTVVI